MQLCHAGRTYCSEDCKSISAHVQELVSQTDIHGYVQPDGLSFPDGMVVTWTMGKSNVATSQATKIIIPAAKELLSGFISATRIVDDKEIQLIEAFVENSHPMWQFNNVYTMTLWKDCLPGKKRSLKVTLLWLPTLIL